MAVHIVHCSNWGANPITDIEYLLWHVFNMIYIYLLPVFYQTVVKCVALINYIFDDNFLTECLEEIKGTMWAPGGPNNPW